MNMQRCLTIKQFVRQSQRELRGETQCSWIDASLCRNDDTVRDLYYKYLAQYFSEHRAFPSHIKQFLKQKSRLATLREYTGLHLDIQDLFS